MTELLYFIPNPKLFTIEEFIDPITLSEYKSKGLDPWTIMDTRLLYCAQGLRIRLDVPLIINNWNHGGDRKWSGFRRYVCPEWSATSQHSFGKALDIVSPDMSAEVMRNIIFADPMNDAWKYITAIEVTHNNQPISWLHIDVRNYDKVNKGILKIEA